MPLTQLQRRILSQLAELIFPKTDDGPGASDLGVVTYLENRLDSAWGRGRDLYDHAPFDPTADRLLGWQTPLSPQALYQLMLEAINLWAMETTGLPFDRLPAADATGIFAMLADGSFQSRVEAPVWLFYDLLLKHVSEGVFRDPRLGGNASGKGWEWLTAVYERDRRAGAL